MEEKRDETKGQSEEEIKERKEKLSNLFRKIFKKKHLYFIGLILIIILALFLRVQNYELLKNKVTGDFIPLELDSFLFYRFSEYILQHDSLMDIDYQRYHPIGVDPRFENMFLSYVIAYVYKIMALLYPATTLGLADIAYPLIFFVLAIFPFYFLVKDIFDRRVAIIATLLLSIMPAYIYRTMLGFADKEPLGLFFMYLAIYLYIKAIKSKKLYENLFFGALAGFSTGLMGLSWGGFKFLIVIVALYTLVLFLLNKIENKDIYVYAAWMACFSIVLTLFTTKYMGIKGLATSTTTGIAFIVFAILILDIIIKRTKISEKINLPNNVTVVLIILIIGLIGSVALLLLPSFSEASLFSMANDMKNLVMSGGYGVDRLSLTVAENKQPYVEEWIAQFGFIFLFFLIGCIILFYMLVKQMPRYSKYMTTAFGAFLILFIFSNYSQNSVLNGQNIFSKIVYLGSAGLFGLFMIIMFFYMYYKDKESFSKLREMDRYAIFFFVWMFIMLVAGRSAIRLLLMLAPVMAIASAYMFVKIFSYSKKIKDNLYRKGSAVCIAAALILIILSNTASSYSTAKQTYPPYSEQWQYDMNWVKNNIADDAVFAHWWDYGYWVQTGGGKATITDGGNYYPYWNHLMGRHVLAAKSEEEALKFLKVHKATHLLIISDEIGKYTAYSSIGSDENFDIFSWISTFVMDPKSTTKKDDTITYLFYGGTALDENFVYNGKVFPQKTAYIAGFLIPVKESEDDYEILQPKAILFYNGQREEVPVECVYDKKKIFFNETGMKGCIRIIPRILPGFQYQQENGALLWVSRKGMDALWTKLFLFDEKSDNFELVFDDSGMNKLAYYNGNVMGPMKIWKIHYPENFTVEKELEDEYLALTTPEWMKLQGITL